MDTLFAELSHNYDPLGLILKAIESSSMISTCNIPYSIVLKLCSYLEYLETTMNGVPSRGVYTYSPRTRNELCVAIHTPKETLLPNNVYVLSEIKFPFRGSAHKQVNYYAAIQLFDAQQCYEPGKGIIIFKSEIMDSFNVTDKEEKMCQLSPNIELQCGKSYLFFIKQVGKINNDTHGLCIHLADKTNTINAPILDELKFCSTVFWYSAYKPPGEYINYFEFVFHSKG
eukprot:415241_1